MYDGNPGKSIFVRVSARLELARVRVIGRRLLPSEVGGGGGGGEVAIRTSRTTKAMRRDTSLMEKEFKPKYSEFMRTAHVF